MRNKISKVINSFVGKGVFLLYLVILQSCTNYNFFTQIVFHNAITAEFSTINIYCVNSIQKRVINLVRLVEGVHYHLQQTVVETLILSKLPGISFLHSFCSCQHSTEIDEPEKRYLHFFFKCTSIRCNSKIIK